MIQRKKAYWQERLRIGAVMLLLLALTACFSDESPEVYYGRVAVQHAQSFRWSDGGLPQTFDPAFAAAPPDTDLIRAIFEGLTDYDPRTLDPVPGVATRWESSNGGRIWTFYLRQDARWSNGDPVTARDFVRSWERTVKIGELAPHTELLSNIQGVGAFAPKPVEPKPEEKKTTNEATAVRTQPRFGARALDDHTLRVELQHPDMNFPALVAHPVFRPVKTKGGLDTSTRIGPTELISNGAFLLAKTDPDRILLERADNYWAKNAVSLDQVEFVGSKDVEAALAAYRAGDVDAVTNAAFEPLAIKLLTPYEDFRRATFGALTYYSYNISHQPFDDVRVREALALAIDRERISEDDMGGATQPARKFLPEPMTKNEVVVGKSALLEKDPARARELLSEAGYPDGKGFPKVRLLINRNEQQRLVAQGIAAMWRNVLHIDTEIISKSWDEYEAAIRAGDYDVVRRGLVMQTTDELTNIRLLFSSERQGPGPAKPQPSPTAAANEVVTNKKVTAQETAASQPNSIESEEQALLELRAMPIYFASSYALVKPYVIGFDANVLDIPSLKTVRINTQWQEPTPQRASVMR